MLVDLIAPARRLAVVGLAKNTGKTETLGAILRELEERRLSVGVTSVGRDGEARDAIDNRIEKPLVRLCAGSLVATTTALLRASAISHELVLDTGIRTPLGRVAIARLRDAGAIEVAGPSAAQDVRAVADAMLDLGAELVLIDGAVDRRAASMPTVSDGLVMCTGAVLHEEIDRVVELTSDAVELARLPEVRAAHVRALASSGSESLLVCGEEPEAKPLVLPPRFALTSTASEVASLLRANPAVSHVVVHGALCEQFLQRLLAVRRPLELVVADASRVFLGAHGCEWYRRQGLTIRVLQEIRLCALTANPVAPRSHSFDSQHLCGLLAAGIPGVPVLDVRKPAHRGAPVA